MATDAVSAESFPSTTTYRPVNRRAERIFFGGMAILLCVVVFIGFSPTYFRAGMVRAPLPNRLLHIHGAVFTTWMILYAVQSALISARRVAWHRSLGTFAFCLTPIMIVIGTVAALDALRRGVRIGPLDPAVSLAIPLVGIAPLALLFYGAWRARRKPDTHKRLILLATIGMVEAAFGRFPWGQMGLPPASGALIGLGLMILLVVAYDLFSLHRIHRSTMWAAPLVFLTGAGAVPIGMTAAWHAFAGFLAKYVAPHV
jgi:hypothetical protein